MKTLHIIFIYALLFHAAAAQTFRVEVPSKVSLDEYFHLRFIVTSDKAADFRPPSLTSFNILAGPSVSRSSSYQMINGKTSSSTTTTYTYVLSPRCTGTFSIGSATVSVGSSSLHTAAQTVRVVAGTTVPQAPGQGSQRDAQTDELQPAGSRITNRDLYISLMPSRTKVYEQEAVLLTYKVHARSGVGLSNVMLSAKPDFTGLIAHEIPVKTIDTTPQTIGGVVYRTGTILQELVFPTQSGEIVVPPVTFICTVAQRQQHGSDPLDIFFNSGGTVGVQVQRTAPALSLSVIPLPQPQPQGFCGAVGKFRISLSSPSTKVRAQEPMHIVVKVEGSGNMQMITPPQLPMPDGVNISAPAQQEDVKTISDGQAGSVTYTYTIVPSTEGKLHIPDLRYDYFNPATGRYEQAVARGLTVNVGAPQAYANSRSTDPGHADHAAAGFPWIPVVAAVLLAACVIVFIFLRRHGMKGLSTLLRHTRSVEKQHLRALRKQLASRPVDTAALELSLHVYLSQRLSIPPGQLSREAVAARLDMTGFPDDDAHALLAALDYLAQASFAAVPDVQTDAEALSGLSRALEQLNKWRGL